MPSFDHPHDVYGLSADRRPKKSPTRRFISVVATTLALSSSAIAAAADLTPPTVAVINGQAVSEDEFAGYFQAYLRSKLYHGGSAEQAAQLASEAMENLILDRLLVAEADRRAIAADPDTVTQRLAAIEKRFRDSEVWPQVEAQLPEIRKEIEAQARIEQLKSEVERVTEPTEADLRTFYQANPDLFTQPRSFDLDVILLRILPSASKDEWNAAQNEAEELHASILAGQSFTDLARELATGSLAETGGKLGRVHAGQLVPSAEELIVATEVGDITKPIRLLDGVAIFRVNAKNEPTISPFETVRDRAGALYERTRAEKKWSKLLSELRAGADVTIADITSMVPRLMQSVGAR